MNTEQNYSQRDPHANTTEQTVNSDQNATSAGSESESINADWFVETDSMYRTVSAQASTAIVQEVAGLFEKFSSKHITATLQEVIVAYQENRELESDEFSVLVALLQIIPQLELPLLLGRKQN
ncbi:hypothetical protein GCM10028808_30280 [Spirosoma migulaei]